MEKPEISDKGYVGNKWNTQKDFESIKGFGVNSLDNSISEIEKLIEERKELSESFIKEGEKMKRDINNFLLENTTKGVDDSEFAKERAELRKKQLDISELQLNEKIGCWKDIAVLKKELREKERESTEKKSRSDLIRGILEE